MNKLENEFMQELTNFTGISNISMDSHLKNDLNLDSLDTVEIIVHLENKFGTEISSDPHYQTIRDLYTQLI